MSEIVAYIKNNKDLIDGITTSKVNVSDIVNDLISTDINKPLSAKQGKILKDLIDTLTINVEDITVPTKTSELINDSNFLTKNGDSSITKSTGQYEGIEGDILLDINSDGYPTLNILKGSNLLRKKFAEIIEWSNKYTIKLKELFNSKVDKVDGKGLSSNDFTDEDKNTLSELANGSINNSTQSDWNVTDTNSGAYIKNKPTKLSQFTNDAGYSKLSFTPVQQSGGIGQSTNKVYIGWDNKGHLKATVDKTDMGSILTTGNPNSGINDLVKKAGDTMTGPLNFANNTWNAVGDDVKIGNVNQAGKLGIMGNNGHTGISFFKQNDASKKKDIVYDGINLNVASSDVVTNSQLNSGDPAYLPPGLYDNNGNGDIGSTGQGRYFNVIHMGEYGNFATQLLMPYQTGYQTRAYIRKQDGGNWSAMQELVSTLNLNTYLANQPAFTELKNSVSNGKAQVASAITAKGVSTAANATFATMASNIASIIAGGSGVYFSKYQAGSKTITANDNYKFGFGVSLGEFTLKINNVDVTNKCISTEGGVHIKLKFYNFPINAGDVFTMVTSANYYAVFVLG